MNGNVLAAERVGPFRRFATLLSQEASAGDRIASIDALRGLTILLMIFVNDVAGVQGAPAWMKHVDPPNADGMTFVDVIFPAFLFIVGMSVPFAFRRRLQRESIGHVWRHVLVRTGSLLLIGVFMVNTEVISDEGAMSPPLWMLLMYVGVILVWATPPAGVSVSRRALSAMRLAGFGLLAVLAVLYESSDVSGVIEMRPYWWGILGLIGWAYLVACAAYLLFREHVPALVGTMALLYCLYMADAAGYFSGLIWVTDWISIGSTLGSHGALTVSGVVLGCILLPDSPMKTHAARIRWALGYGLGLAAAAHLLHAASGVHDMFIVNKILATPPWCLWSAAITVWVWVAIYALLDVAKWTRWSTPLERAGQNALLAYVLAPMFYAALALIAVTFAMPNVYSTLGGSFAAGLTRSIVFAVGVTWMAASFRKAGFRLKL